jgi:hypothetical protein
MKNAKNIKLSEVSGFDLSADDAVSNKAGLIDCGGNRRCACLNRVDCWFDDLDNQKREIGC